MSSVLRLFYFGLILLCASAPARCASVEKIKWTIYQTPHFELLTDASESEATRNLTRLETYRAAMASLPGHGLISQLPTRVYLLESDATFFKLRHTEWAAAVFQAAPTENLLLISVSRDRPVEGWKSSDSRGAASARKVQNLQNAGQSSLHEFTHLLFRRHGEDWPLWFHEGVAQMFATAEFRGDKAIFGLPDQGNLLVLRRLSWLPLDRVFAETSESQSDESSDAVGEFYAESWLTAHYCFFNSNQGKSFGAGNFLKLLNSGVPTQEVFTKAYGLDLKQLESTLDAYYHSGKYGTIELAIPPLPAEAIHPKSRPAKPGEALAWLGDWCLGPTNQWSTAEELYALSLKTAPGNPFGTLGMGRLAEEQGNQTKADTLLREAVRLEPENPWTHYWLAQALSTASRDAETSTGTDIKIPTEALAEYRRATELGPKLAPVWAALGQALVQNGDASNDPLNALRKAWDLDPGDLWLVLVQAEAMRQRGQKDQALQMLDTVAKSAGTTSVGRRASAMAAGLHP